MNWVWNASKTTVLCLETQARIHIVHEALPADDNAPWHIVTNSPSAPGELLTLAVFEGDGAETRARKALAFIALELKASDFSGLGKAQAV
jgi:hypothetical protein